APTAAPDCAALIAAPDARGCIRRKARLPFDHHAIAVANAAGDDGETARRSLDDDRTLPRRIGTVDAVDVLPTLARDDRLRRHDERAVLVEQVKRRRRELSGPETAIAVVEAGLELYGAGRRIDGIVNERQLADHALASQSALLPDQLGAAGRIW